MHKELKRCEPRVASLQAANQVCASQQIEKLETSQDKLNHLRLRLQSLIRVTWLYMLKLGGVLGYDMTDMYASTLSTATPMTMSQEVCTSIVMFLVLNIGSFKIVDRLR